MEAGELLKAHDYHFDRAYTSLLKRAIHTLWIVLDEINQARIPIEKTWQLNERHYGSLQGLNKAKAAEEYGEEQVRVWRRSYDVRPPALAANDPTHPRNDARYAHLHRDQLPDSESLADTLKRVLPYWRQHIAPNIQKDENLLIAAHGNSLRALIKHLEGISKIEIMGLEIPTGNPLVYEFGDKLTVINKYYLKKQSIGQNAA